MALLTDLVKEVKTMFFKAIFDQSIVSQFQIIYFEHKFDRWTTLCITKVWALFQLY